MRLRSSLLLATLLVGVGVGALELVARSTARELAQALEPVATLHYESAGIAIDGSIRLREPRLTINRGIWKGRVMARVADLRGGGPFWLLAHALGRGPQLPEQMRIHTRGLHLGDEATGVPLGGWFGTSDLALFENLGCGSDALSDKDRVRMGIETHERDDEFRYQFAPPTHSLAISMDLHSKGVAAIHASAQLTGFAGKQWLEPAALTELRVARVSFGYQDFGYFARRNQFCAQWLGVSAAQFIEKHLEAVRAFLGVRGITPGREVLSLYEKLATGGGSLKLTSLPDSSWLPAEINAYPKEDLLRRLNITARLEDAPPIMLRLSFAAPESPLSITSVVDPPVAVPLTPVDADIPASDKPGFEAGVDDSAATESVVAEAPVTSGLNTPSVVSAESTATQNSTADESDAEVVEVRPLSQSWERRVIASAPPPPKDSTLALVWKPGVIERLPEQTIPDKEYSVIGKDRLHGMIGARVQLLTENGKRVDGDVLKVSGGAVVLSIAVVRGKAELSVPLDVVREVRLRADSSDSP